MPMTMPSDGLIDLRFQELFAPHFYRALDPAPHVRARFSLLAPSEPTPPKPEPPKLDPECYPVLASLGFVFPGAMEARTESGVITRSTCPTCGQRLCNEAG